ncbi:MAG: hypothetical protein Q8P44_04060 [Dehalococcoidia bacterium]|nr:hypothetical protein [Dehalococcoidia bacterium]
MVVSRDLIGAPEYRDEGCQAFPLCLSCPLPYCLEDDLAGIRKWLKKRRDQEVRAHRRKGKNTAEIALIMGISRRTVQRVVRGKTAGEVGVSPRPDISGLSAAGSRNGERSAYPPEKGKDKDE